MPDNSFIERLIVERDELNEKIQKLDSFIHYDVYFDKLAPMQKDLLKAQWHSMLTYSNILVIRINCLESEGKDD